MAYPPDVSKLLWLNGGLPQAIKSGDSVLAQGTWTFDSSGTMTVSGPINAAGGKFTVDASGNVEASGNLAIGGTATVAGIAQFNSDVNVSGDLVVNGSIISRGQIDVVIQDAFLDLAFGNSIAGSASVASTAGGFTVTQARNTNFVAGQVTNFPSSTTFVYDDISGSTLLVTGDVVEITGLPQNLGENEGLFVVDAVDQAAFPQTVTIKTSGLQSAPWAQTALEVGAVSPVGTAFKPNLSVLAIADGSPAFKGIAGNTWPVGTLTLASYVGADASGATLDMFDASGAYVAVGAGSTTLQNAYDNGNQIITASGDGNVIITGTEKLFVTASGGIDVSGVTLRARISDGSGIDIQGGVVVDIGTDTNVTQVDVNSANWINLVAGDDSGWQVTSGDLGFSATGKITAIVPAGQVLLDASGAQVDLSGNIAAVDASDAVVLTAPRISLDSSGADLDLSGGVITGVALNGIDLSGSSIESYSTAQTTLTAATQLTASGSASFLDLSGNAALDSTGAINLTADASSSWSVSLGDLSLSAANIVDLSGVQVNAEGSTSITATSPDITLDASSATLELADATKSIVGIADVILLDASGAQLDLSNNIAAIDASGAISLGAGATSDFTVSTGDLNLSAAGDVDLSGATITGWSSAATSFTALSFLADASGAQLDLSNDQAQLDASGAVSIGAGAASDFTVSSGDLTLATTSNSINLSAAEAAVDAIKLDASGGSISAFTQSLQLKNSSGAGVLVRNMSGGAVTLAVGNLITLVPNANPGTDYIPEVKKADATAASPGARCFGVVGLSAIADTDTGYATTLPGTVARVKFQSGNAPTGAAQIGAPVFVSTTAGEASMTAPSGSTQAVVQVGYLVSATADANTNYCVVLAPQFIGQIP